MDDFTRAEVEAQEMRRPYTKLCFVHGIFWRMP